MLRVPMPSSMMTKSNDGCPTEARTRINEAFADAEASTIILRVPRQREPRTRQVRFQQNFCSNALSGCELSI
jgi:hypothetical protein